MSTLKDALLTGIANMLAFIYAQLAYLRLQTRIATATDGFLDLIAADYFGADLPRLANQGDPSYRARIQAALFLERGTRNGLIRVLTQITGRTPIVFEPTRPADTGGYGVALGYSVAGGYGSLAYPYQSFVTAFRPAWTGLANIAGYGVSTGAYNTPGSQAQYASLSTVGGIQDSDIYAAIDSVRVAGTIIWARIS